MPWQTIATLILVSPLLALSLAGLAAGALDIAEQIRADDRAPPSRRRLDADLDGRAADGFASEAAAR